MKHAKYCLLLVLVLGLGGLTGCNPGSCRGSDPLVGRTRLEPPKTERRPVYAQNRGYGDCGVVAGQPLGIPKARIQCTPCGTCQTTCDPCASCAASPAPVGNSCQTTPPTYTPSSAQTVSRENGGWLPVTPAREENTTVRGQEPHTILATEESTTHITRYPNEEKTEPKPEKKHRWVTPQTSPATVSAPPPPTGELRKSYQSDFSYEKIVPGAKPQTPTPKQTFFTQTFAPKPNTANVRYEQEKAALAATFEERYLSIPIPSNRMAGTPCTTCTPAATSVQTPHPTGWLVSAPEAKTVEPHVAVGSQGVVPEKKEPEAAPVPSRTPSSETEPGVLDFLSLPE
ncbi:MAG: hypothetical protein Q4D98_02935 [Planctomycetia bacterium]|nr:hypothetical protein [Planctomycetia bacterium]